MMYSGGNAVSGVWNKSGTTADRISTDKSGLNTEIRNVRAGCATRVAVPAPPVPFLRVLNARSIPVSETVAPSCA